MNVQSSCAAPGPSNIEVIQSVAIHIPDCHSRAILGVLVGQQGLKQEVVVVGLFVAIDLDQAILVRNKSIKHRVRSLPVRTTGARAGQTQSLIGLQVAHHPAGSVRKIQAKFSDQGVCSKTEMSGKRHGGQVSAHRKKLMILNIIPMP